MTKKYEGKDAARRFVELLDGDLSEAAACWRTFPDRDRGSGKSYVGAFEEVLPALERDEKHGRGVFRVINLGGHKNAEITTVVAFFVDGDKTALPETWHLPPTFICERGSRWHSYWLAAVGTDADAQTFRRIQKRLAKHYGGDPVVCNLSRVMRLPGFAHHKNGPGGRGYTLTDFEDDSRRYTVEEIAQGLPELDGPAGRVRGPIGGEYDGEPDQPQHMQRAHQWLRQRDVAVENIIEDGANGNDWTYKTACALLEFALSADGVVGVMMRGDPIHDGKSWAGRCKRPWDDYDELLAVVEHAVEYCENPWGCRITGAKAEVQRVGGGGSGGDVPADDEPVRIERVSFGDLLAVPAKPVVDLWDGFIEKYQANFWAGPGFAGKSGLILQVGVGVALGFEVLNRKTHCALFDYHSAEDDDNEVRRRVHALAAGLGLDDDQRTQLADRADLIDRYKKKNALAVVSDTGIKFTDFYKALQDDIGSRPEHTLVALDSCYNFVNFSGHAKINEDAVRAFVDEVLGSLCGPEIDATLIIPWHPSHAGQERGDGSGWSVAWDNAPRLKAMFTRNQSKVGTGKAAKLVYDGTYTLSVPGRNHGPAPEPLELKRNGFAFEVFKTGKTFVELAEQRDMRKAALAEMIAVLTRVAGEKNGGAELGLASGAPLELHRSGIAKAAAASLEHPNSRLAQQWGPMARAAGLEHVSSVTQFRAHVAEIFFKRMVGSTALEPRTDTKVATSAGVLRLSAKGVFYFEPLSGALAE